MDKNFKQNVQVDSAAEPLDIPRLVRASSDEQIGLDAKPDPIEIEYIFKASGPDLRVIECKKHKGEIESVKFYELPLEAIVETLTFGQSHSRAGEVSVDCEVVQAVLGKWLRVDELSQPFHRSEQSPCKDQPADDSLDSKQ